MEGTQVTPASICFLSKRKRLYLVFARSAEANPGSQEIVPRHGVGHLPIFHDRKIQQALPLHGLHRFFYYGLACDSDSLVNYDFFRGQLRKILAGFQRTENIKFTDASNELISIIDHWRTGSMGGQ